MESNDYRLFSIPVVTLLLNIVFAVLYSPLFSQVVQGKAVKGSIEFDRIGNAEGLPYEWSAVVTQDKYGFMWFGTMSGLYRYDGRNLKEFLANPDDPKALIGNEIQLLFSDSRGMLWVGGNGLHRYRFEQESFERFVPPQYDPLFEKLKYTAPIAEDPDGNLWLGTFNQGLFKFDPLSGQLEAIDLGGGAEDSQQSNAIYSISATATDTLWICTSNRQIVALNRRTRHYTRYPLSSKGDIQTAFVDPRGRLWLGETGKPLQQVFVRPGGQLDFAYIDGIITDNFFSTIKGDRHGNIWVGTSMNGLYQFSPGNKRLRHYLHASDDPNSLPGNVIQDIYEDFAGNIWIATDKGIAKWARWKKNFRHFQHDTGSENSISNAEVTGIDQDRMGNLWISTLNSGFCKFDPRSGNFTRYDPASSNAKTPWAIEILADRNNAIWVGTNSRHGLNRYDTDSGKFREYLHSAEDSTTLSGNVITTLFETNQGRIWAGAAYRGLNLYEPRIDGFRRFQHAAGDTLSLSNDNVLSMFEDRNSTLWIGTSDGLNRYDPQFSNFRRYVALEADGRKAGQFEVNSIFEDSGGDFWLAANQGIRRFNRDTGILETAEGAAGMISEKIFSINEDDSGNLWLQASSSIIKYNSHKDRVRVYDREDGWIQGTNFEQEWRHAAKKLASGELVYGGVRGITMFDPDSVQDSPNIPPVRITAFRIFYEPVEFGNNPLGPRSEGDSILTRSILVSDQMTLNHRENTFSFEFAALEYTSPKANRYAFMLEGFNHDWVDIGNAGTATFTNLSPGEYIFRAKAANSDGIWNESGRDIRITILPPWWATGWAYIIYGLIGALTLYGLRRFDLKRIRMQNQLKIKEIEAEKLLEIDSMKSRFFANISHEFRTPLTLILGPIDDAIDESTDRRMLGRLALMKRNALRLKRLINQLLDLSRLEAGRMNLKTVHGRFCDFARNLVLSFGSLADQRKLTLVFKCDQEMEALVNEQLFFDMDMIEKILSNLLSNACKFTPAGGRIEVVVGRDRRSAPRKNGESEIVMIRVADSGIGIAPDRLPHVFDRFYQVDSSHTREQEGTGIGLALVHELVRRHHGTISVSSEVDQGTEFMLFLPLGNQHLSADEIDSRPEGSQIFEPEEILLPSADPMALPLLQDLPASDSTLILIIDDNIDMRAHIRTQLEPEYQVIEAADGVEGIAIAIDTVPDLVICDVMMPKMDGFQVCEALKTEFTTSHIPFILLTAKAGEESKLTGLETGSDDYLIKPFSVKELRARVRNLIELRRKLRERFFREGMLQPREVESASMEEVFLQRLKDVLEANLTEENFGLETLCDEMQMSERQLQRKLRALVGQSPSEIIRGARLQRAKDLLEQRSGTVSEIAYAVGFNNLSYFAKCFRERYGVSPSELLQKITRSI